MTARESGAGSADSLPPLHGATFRALEGHEMRTGKSPFVPLLVFFLAAAMWSAFQFLQLQLESETLVVLRANQEAQLQQAQKVRATLDAMALQTQKLADAGNANARLVVEELRKRGITINRPAVESTK